MRTKQCAPLKHHYDECAERVQQQEEEKGKAEEDCVEECKSYIPPCDALQYCQLEKIHLTLLSLPHDALRQPMRCTEALLAAAINHENE